MSDESTRPTPELPAAADAAGPPDPPPPAHAAAAETDGSPTLALVADHDAVAEAAGVEAEAETAVEAEPDAAAAPEVDEEPVAEAATAEPAAEAEPEDADEVAAEAPPAIRHAVEVPADHAAEVAAAEVATAAEPEPEPAAEAAPAEPAVPESNKKWYVVKVQSNREDSIKAAVERQVKIQGLEEFFGQIVIPVEEFYEKKKVSVKDKKTGQKVTEERNVTKHRKKYPGYLFAEVEFNDRILYVFRETSGVGDFVGATHHRAPNPMPDREVQQMLTGVIDKNDTGRQRKIKVKLDFEKGDKVRIRDGAFAGSEAEVKAITEPKDPTDPPKVTVVVTIWGRPVEMEMDSFQVDKA